MYSTAAKLKHLSNYICLNKDFISDLQSGGILLSIAGMGQAFSTPPFIRPPLTLPSRQMHLDHGDAVHSLTSIDFSMPGPLNGITSVLWQKNWYPLSCVVQSGPYHWHTNKYSFIVITKACSWPLTKVQEKTLW